MPLNSRYLKGPYSSTSSLYKKLKRAEEKIQRVTDAETKFLWDTGQIGNEQYLQYSKKRFEESKASADEFDQFSWGRSVMSVEREIRSDKRLERMFQISQMPGNGSDVAKARAEMYYELAKDAYEDGDNDAYITAMTQYNNAVEVYQNKLESEAKAGYNKAKRAVNTQFKLEQNAIDKERIKINTDPDLVNDPLNKAALLANLDAKEYMLNQRKLNSTDDPVEQGNIEEKMMKLESRAMGHSQKVKGTWDKDGTFTPEIAEDAQGNRLLKPGDSVDLVYDNGIAKIRDKQSKRISSLKTDEEGNTGWVTEEGLLGDENFAEMIDEDTGITYFSKIQTEDTIIDENGNEVPKEKKIGDDGAYVDSKEDAKRKVYVIDRFGNRRRFNPNSQKFDLYWNPLDLSNRAVKDTNFGFDKMTRGLNSTLAYKTNLARLEEQARQEELARRMAVTLPVTPVVNPFTNQFPVMRAMAPLRQPAPSASAIRASKTVGTPEFHQSFFGTGPGSFPAPAPTPQPSGVTQGGVRTGLVQDAWRGVKKWFGW